MPSSTIKTTYIYLTYYHAPAIALIFLIIFGVVYTRKLKHLNRRVRVTLLSLSLALIIYKTVFNRTVGSERLYNLTPFWSYAELGKRAVSHEILLNIFLFIPFGFLLAWSKKWSMAKVVLTGCIFSVLIEATQYIFCLGLCEFDDVFHNTLGTALGYWYWRGLERVSRKLKPQPNQGEQ